MKAKICGRCKLRPRKAHWNSKWCAPCARALARAPRGTLTAVQIAFARKHAGDKPISEIAKHLKTSISNLKRSCRGVPFYFHNGKYKHRPELVRQVLDYYFEHGKPETEKAFPGVKVRSITDRPEYYGVARKHRQTRWTDEQWIEAVKMGGLISFEAQARYFNRPRANAGSLKSFWVKNMKMAGGQLWGMADWNARWIVTDRCPRLRVGFAAPRDPAAPEGDGTRPLVLWVDAEKHLRPGTPEFVASSVVAMAQFTRRMFGANAKQAIVKMIKTRT